MTNEETISNFLRTAYTDERLAALLAHVEDGKFSFSSCCCIRGAANADHALKGYMNGIAYFWARHYQNAADIPGAQQAERALLKMVEDDEGDREKWDVRARAVMLPLVHAEIARRDQVTCDTRDNNQTQELAGVLK